MAKKTKIESMATLLMKWEWGIDAIEEDGEMKQIFVCGYLIEDDNGRFYVMNAGEDVYNAVTTKAVLNFLERELL